MSNHVCIYVNDLPNVLFHCVQLYTGTPKENIGSCLDYISRGLVRIDNWASAKGLCINPSKSKCIIHSMTDRSFVIPLLSIRGNQIDFVKSATNLGIGFNGRLSWSNHVSFAIGRIILFYFILFFFFLRNFSWQFDILSAFF